MAARQQQYLSAGHEQRLDQGEQGDDRALAGLAAAVQEQPRVAGLEDIDLPRSGSRPRLRITWTAGGREDVDMGNLAWGTKRKTPPPNPLSASGRGSGGTT